MGSGGGGGGVVGGAKPAVAMVAVEFVFSALQIFIKLALDDGMDVRVLVAYRLMFATAFLCPLAFLVESEPLCFRRKKRPPLTMKVLLGLFLCGLFGIAINQNLLVLAMKLTNSTTIVTALSNLTPQSTFIVAILARQEIVKLGRASGRAKLAGTLVGLGGAMVVTFYRGPELAFMHRLARAAGLRHGGSGRGATAAAAAVSPAARVVGSFLAISSCFSYAVWLSIQARVGEAFPCHYSIAALVCLSGAAQSALLALCFHRDAAHWRLGLDVRLYSSAYAGIVASGFAFPLMSWCLRERGPLYVAMFGPLIIVFVAVLSSVFLDETLHLGIALGAVLIVAGLYMVLWGKAREAQEKAAGVLPQDEEQGEESAGPADAANGETK
ncbi:WAT1-related protein [Panicum miliaceum]|uniref:WAT1-related protein n=1 Tax=Panicum miliaceum TaxID=4540 RepID=A0A3L6Q6U7_PANMI|nr:WAT1-related protein [Panicum miliaceum]